MRVRHPQHHRHLRHLRLLRLRLRGRLRLRFDAPGPIIARHYLRPTDMEALS